MSRRVEPAKEQATFDDVARSGRAPNGVLTEPSCTGMTLLARSTTREASVAPLSAIAPAPIEIIVGLGARRLSEEGHLRLPVSSPDRP